MIKIVYCPICGNTHGPDIPNVIIIRPDDNFGWAYCNLCQKELDRGLIALVEVDSTLSKDPNILKSRIVDPGAVYRTSRALFIRPVVIDRYFKGDIPVIAGRMYFLDVNDVRVNQFFSLMKFTFEHKN